MGDTERPEHVTEAPSDESPADDQPEAAAAAPAKPSRRRSTRGGAARKSAGGADATPPAEPEAEESQADADSPEAPLDEEPGRSPRKRGRRRGRGRGGSRGLEGRLLPGTVLLLDPSVANDATFQEHWADAGALRVEVSTDAIVLRRIAADTEPEQAKS